MRLLVLGGTSFVGRHLVAAALDGGHDVTLLNRGRTNPDLFPQAEHRVGDRTTGDLTALGNGTWDATVDVSAYLPRQVDEALDALEHRGGHYVLVSSVSAYDPARATRDESSPTYDAAPATEQVTAETYGPLKAACERRAQARLPDDGWTIVRPTYVVGPYDPTDRFTYWARALADGGAVPVAWPDAPVLVIDARDLGAFMLRLATTSTGGAFDGVGPYGPFGAMLHTMTPAGVDVDIVDVGHDRLEAAGVSLPLVDGDPQAVPLLTRPGARAIGAGLVCRSLQASTADTVAWDDARGRPPLIVGPTPEQRAGLLAQGAVS